MNITFKKLGLSQEDISNMRKHGLLLDKRTMHQLQKSYETNYQITLDDINLIEMKIGYELPQDYKSFLIKYNGGYPSKSKINEDVMINYFLGLKLDYKEDTILENYLLISELHGISNAIPIAVTPSGDYFLLSNSGQIFLFEHDLIYSDQDELLLISHSFSELLELLN